MPDQKTMENYLSNEPYFGTIGENDQNEFWRAGSWIGPIVHSSGFKRVVLSLTAQPVTYSLSKK